MKDAYQNLSKHVVYIGARYIERIMLNMEGLSAQLSLKKKIDLTTSCEVELLF